MLPTVKKEEVRPGDIVVIEHHRVGDHPWTGEILEVLRDGDREHYRVRWEDGRESVFYPRGGFSIRDRARRP